MRQDRDRSKVRVLPGVNFTKQGIVVISLGEWARLRAWGATTRNVGGMLITLSAPSPQCWVTK